MRFVDRIKILFVHWCIRVSFFFTEKVDKIFASNRIQQVKASEWQCVSSFLTAVQHNQDHSAPVKIQRRRLSVCLFCSADVATIALRGSHKPPGEWNTQQGLGDRTLVGSSTPRYRASKLASAKKFSWNINIILLRSLCHTNPPHVICIYWLIFCFCTLIVLITLHCCYYASALLAEALSNDARLTSDVSVAYIGPKSRTERPMKTKIGT